MKTSELKGIALDWAVAKIENPEWWDDGYMDGRPMRIGRFKRRIASPDGGTYSPSTNWAQGGSIIEREWISLFINGDDRWVASTGIKAAVADTPLVAVMRCYVASKLGDDIELPEEIGG